MGTLKVDNIQSTTDGSVTLPQGTILPSGSASTPSVSFSGNTNTGIYKIVDNAIGISTGGTLRTRIDNSGIEVIDGSASTPSISFLNSSTTGLYRIGANTIGIASNGTRVGEIGNGYGGFTGNVIQTINSSNSYSHVITSISYTDILSAVGTTWEIAITPKYANSKILIIYSIVGQLYISGNTQYVGFGISKKIGTGSYSRIFSPSAFQFGVAIGGGNSLYYNNQNTNLYNDTSSTTQEIKYKIEGLIYNNASSGAFYVNSINGGGGGTMISTVNILEIQQ